MAYKRKQVGSGRGSGRNPKWLRRRWYRRKGMGAHRTGREVWTWWLPSRWFRW